MTAKVETKCAICGDKLYKSRSIIEYKCDLCGNNYKSQKYCKNGHKICSECAVKEFFEIARQVCLNTKSKNPIEIAEIIMDHPDFTLIGCKHYIVAPLALFTAFKNSGGKVHDFEKSLDKIKDTAMESKIGLCEDGGLCAIPSSLGRSMYYTKPDNLDLDEAKITANQMSAFVMRAITNPIYIGSNTCCKRNVYMAIISGIIFFRNNLWVDMVLPSVVKCKYSQGNPRCNKEMCLLFNGRQMMKYFT